jgi:hypothetical protein
MPEPLTTAAIGVAAVGTVANIAGGIIGANKDEKAARRNAKFVYSQRMEEIRRMQYVQAQQEGNALARAYASNLQFSGSVKNYVEELRAENRYQVAWARSAARKEAERIKDSGKSPGLVPGLIGVAASGLAEGLSIYNSGKTTSTSGG